MRRFAFAIVLMLLPGMAGADLVREHFEAETVASLTKLCQATEADEHGRYAIGFCFGWIEGAGQVYQQVISDDRFGVRPVICAGRELPREEVRTIFLTWSAAKPDAAAMPALQGVVTALKEKFPCS